MYTHFPILDFVCEPCELKSCDRLNLDGILSLQCKFCLPDRQAALLRRLWVGLAEGTTVGR